MGISEGCNVGCRVGLLITSPGVRLLVGCKNKNKDNELLYITFDLDKAPYNYCLHEMMVDARVDWTAA